MTNASKLEQLVSDLSALSILEASDLVEILEKTWGVSAAAPVAVAAAGSAPAAAAEEEQTEFNVILEDAGAKKIDVIKELRAITGLSLTEAKTMAETVGGIAVKEGLSKKDAEDVKKKLEAVGAKVKLV